VFCLSRPRLKLALELGSVLALVQEQGSELESATDLVQVPELEFRFGIYQSQQRLLADLL
jgi:hypothetical protein